MIRWWCSAQGLAWTWDWQPYFGVWLAIGVLAAGYAWLRRTPAPAGVPAGAAASGGRRARTRSLPDSPPHSGRIVRFGLGLVILWTALDWPLGLLGAGYLVTAHVLQYLMIALVVPALLLSGTPPSAFERLRARPSALGAARALTHPILAIGAFAAVMVISHVPSVADTLKASPLGNFAMEAAWLISGTLLWWPVLCPVPERRFHPLARMGYLLLVSVPGTALGMFLVFAEFPQYAVYELAPRVPGLELSVTDDQRLAGLIMKFGAGLVIWTIVSVMFFRWNRQEEENATAASNRSPGHGGATAIG